MMVSEGVLRSFFHEKKEIIKKKNQTPKGDLNMREMIRRKKYIVHVTKFYGFVEVVKDFWVIIFLKK